MTKETLHHPYYIFTQEYAQTSAGDRAMYYLCHLLNERGYEAYVIADEPVPGMDTPILTYEIRQKHKAENRHTIAVYNEMVRGNPLEGDIVVRWIMNKRVVVDGEKLVFPPDDLHFYWSNVFSEKDDCDELRFSPVNNGIFNNSDVADEQREGFCYYAHKYFQHNDGNVSLPKKITET